MASSGSGKLNLASLVEANDVQGKVCLVRVDFNVPLDKQVPKPRFNAVSGG